VVCNRREERENTVLNRLAAENGRGRGSGKMKLSTRSRYGTRLMLDLAEHYLKGPIHLNTIALQQGISVKYLEQIIIPLKKAKYIQSVRGPKGGHILAKPPSEISIGEIVALLEEGASLAECSYNPKVCERSSTCSTRPLWQEAAQAMFDKLNSITLADVLKTAKPGPSEP
jgi:Rrf2 family iron-sulfur cluster assembly transcriptional regulator